MGPRANPQPAATDVPRGDRNRSLERGVAILRAFRPGADLLGNGDLAERTGLSRATVSRLTQTLVDSGMLEHDRRRRAYRLAAPVLSLAHAMRTGSPVLQLAGPLMRTEAEQRKINVGLAVADGDEMVYLESVRYSHRVAWRNVVAGQRAPMELTSLGRA
jgi:DNA-binding IclR family transcriptional regulator